MLTRLHVDNFRCFVNFDCRFERQQLLVGPNGSGKSSVFDVLTLLRDFCVRGVAPDGHFAGRTRTRWQDVREQTFELEVAGPDGDFRLSLVMDSWGNLDRPRVLREEVTWSGRPIFRFADGEVHLFNDRSEDKVQYPFDWHRSALATVTERPENTRLTRFKRWLDGLLFVRPDPRAMSGVASEEARHPDQYLANFADWYRHLRQETNDFQYFEDLANAIEGFLSMRLEDAGERRREVKIRMGPSDIEPHGKYKTEYLLTELSEGQRVLIGLYAVLHFGLRAGSTVCFDEPDNFIALREVQPWLAKVLDRADDEKAPAQVLIASHHPELLNRMAFKSGLSFDRPGGRHTRVQRFGDPSGSGLSASELVVRGWERE